ncbi:MAG: glycosyltransferase, partial [Burkholderiales bacterium]
MSRFVLRLLAALDVRRKRLLASGLFHPSYYLAANPDVASANADAALHYVRLGAEEGRSPHPLFDPEYYARAAGIRGLPRGQWLWHFLRIGETRGISPHPLVDLRRLAAGYGADSPGSGLLARFARDPRPPCNPHPLFDVQFYLQRHPDVASDNINPLVHFVCHGASEGRQPSPFFDTQYYVAQLPRGLPGGVLALRHYLEVGGPLGLSPSPRFDPHAFARRYSGANYRGVDLLSACLEIHGGKVPEEFSPLPVSQTDATSGIKARYAGTIAPEDKRRVLVVAHTASNVLFGAERSLVDMVRGACAAGYAVFGVLPRIAPQYVAELLPHCTEIVVLDYEWWRGARPPDEAAVGVFRRYIAERRIDLVHSNTIMLREPLIAARKEGKPGLVHVREIIEHDPDLLALMGESAETITGQIRDLAHVVIANSQAAARAYPKEQVRVLPNCLDVKTYSLPQRSEDGVVRFGLLSSNVPKKGIADFVALAKGCAHRVPNARFVIIGPETDIVRELQLQLEKEGPQGTVEFSGYIHDSVIAIGSIDVVVNFSHFAESFGRTVLEGMAAARPAIVYDHGALPELVQHGITGFVVPFRRWEAAIPIVERLCADAPLRRELGLKAAQMAARFAFEPYAASLGKIYEEALEGATRRSTGRQRSESRLPPPEQVLQARRLPVRRDRAELKVAFFLWHFPVPSETFVLNELRQLVAAGIDVRVFCRQTPHPDFRPDFPIEWERVSSMEQLAARLTETGRTIVHSHFAYPTVTEFVWPACTAAGIPFTFFPHAQDIFRYDNDERNRIGEVGRSPACLRVLAPGRFHRQYLMERGVPDEKILVLPQGID